VHATIPPAPGQVLPPYGKLGPQQASMGLFAFWVLLRAPPP